MGKHGGMSRAANDARSISMNPNNAAYHASVANRARQLDPSHRTSHPSPTRAVHDASTAQVPGPEEAANGEADGPGSRSAK